MIPATLIAGDGIGPEITEATCRILDAAGVQLDWDKQQAGVGALDETGTPLPDSVMDSVRRTCCALKAPITTPQGKGYKSLNVTIRKTMGLYANVRPSKAMHPFVPSRRSRRFGRRFSQGYQGHSLA